jgi:hypothetical protein
MGRPAHSRWPLTAKGLFTTKRLFTAGPVSLRRGPAPETFRDAGERFDRPSLFVETMR